MNGPVGAPVGDLEDIAALAGDLEDLLQQILADIHTEQPDRELHHLLRPAARQERSFRLEGSLQEILFRYRDIGQQLTETDHARALKALRQGREKIMQGYQLLGQYAFDELSFSDLHWATHVEVVTHLNHMVQRYERAYGDELGSISGRKDDDKNWREFMVACSLACLRCYGIAPNWAVHQLLARKSDGYEYQMSCLQWPKSDQESIKRRVNDLSAQARQRALKLAKLEDWYTHPVIDFASAPKWVRIINQRPTTKEDEVNIERAADKTASGSESVAQFNLQAIWNQSPT